MSLSCTFILSSAAGELARTPGAVADCSRVSGAGDRSTFDELATVDLARCDFEGYDMVLGRNC